MLPKKHNRHNVSFGEQRLLNFSREESSWSPRDRAAEKREKQEALEKAERNKKTAVNELEAKYELRDLDKTVTVKKEKSIYHDREKTDVQLAIKELKSESLAGKDFEVNKEFLNSFNDKDEAREALATGQIKNYRNITRLISDLGINQTELLDHAFGSSGLFGNLLFGASSDTLFEMSYLNNEYGDIEDAEERLIELAKTNENPTEMVRIAEALNNIRALGAQLENLEAAPLSRKHPDYVKDFNFAQGNETLKNKFRNPEILVALMGYYYGIDEAVDRGLLHFNQDPDNNEYDLFIESIPAEDLAMFEEAYAQIDAFRWGFGDYSLTEGIADFIKSENFAKIKEVFDKRRLEAARESNEESELVKATIYQVANPLLRGVITENDQFATSEELTGPGIEGDKPGTHLGRHFSEKAVAETLLRDARDFEKGIYSLAKLAKSLQVYLEKGQLHIMNNPIEDKKLGNLSAKEIPTITAEALKEGLTEDQITLIQYGFVFDHKHERVTTSQIEDLEASFGKPRVEALGGLFASAAFTDKLKLEHLAVGAHVTFEFPEEGNEVTITKDGSVTSIDLGAGTDLLNPLRGLTFGLTVASENAEGDTTTGGIGINPCTLTLGLGASHKEMLNKTHHVRLSGGIATLGPVILGGGVSAGIGRGLDTYVVEHQEKSLEDLSANGKATFEKFKAALEKGASNQELASIAREFTLSDGRKPLEMAYHAQLRRLGEAGQLPPTPKLQDQLDRTTISLFKELNENLRNFAIEKTEEEDFGLEVGAGLAWIGGAIPVPFIYASFELPTGTVTRYSIPEEVPYEAKADLENQIQSQLKAQLGTTTKPGFVTNIESGDVDLDPKGGWVSTERTEVSKVQTLAATPEAQAKELTKDYLKYGINFETIDSPAHEDLRNKGYLAMTFNPDFIGDADLEIHVDPEAKGIHVTTLEGLEGGKIGFATNVRGAENLVITRREYVQPSGEPTIVVTISDTNKELDQIQREEGVYYHYQGGRLQMMEGSHNSTGKQETLGGKITEFTTPLFKGYSEEHYKVSKEILESLTINEKGLETPANELDKLIKQLSTNKRLTKFAAETTARVLENFERPEPGGPLDMIKTAYQKMFNKELTSSADLHYIVEKLTEATFINLSNRPNKRARARQLKQGLKLANKYIGLSLERNPHLKNKFNDKQIKEIRNLLQKDLAQKIKEVDLTDKGLSFQKLEEVGLEQFYLMSTAANPTMDLANRGFRFVDTNDYSTLEVLASSVTRYEIDPKNPNSPESLAARFILEMMDPLPESNDLAQANLLFSSQLATQIATLRAPSESADKDSTFISLALGEVDAERILNLFEQHKSDPDGVEELLMDKNFASAYQEFYALLKEIRTHQVQGRTLTKTYKDTIVDLTFDTKAASMFLKRCGNSTFGFHQDILATYKTPGQRRIGAFATVTPGFKAQDRLQQVTVTPSLAITPDAGPPPPPEDRKEPTPDRPDVPGGEEQPPPGRKTTEGGGGAANRGQGPRAIPGA